MVIKILRFYYYVFLYLNTHAGWLQRERGQDSRVRGVH